MDKWTRVTLFTRPDLEEFLRGRRDSCLHAVEDLTDNQLLSTSLDDLRTQLCQRFQLIVPTINEQAKSTRQPREVEDTVGSRTTQVTFEVPFEGDGELLQYHAKTPPRRNVNAAVYRQSLILTYQHRTPDARAFESSLRADIDAIQDALGSLSLEIARFNALVEKSVHPRLAEKQEAAARRRELAEGLGAVSARATKGSEASVGGFHAKQRRQKGGIVNAPDPKKVFVIHGRNERIRQSMFSFLRALELHPLEWSSLVAATGSGSPPNLEVVLKAFEVAQAIVALHTPDDIAYLRAELRAKQEAPRKSVV